MVKKRKSQRRGQIVALMSSKGGVGKTHLAVSLSAAMAKKGVRVLLIDVDLGNGMVSDRIGLHPKCNLFHFFLKEKGELVDLIEKTPLGFFLIGGKRGDFALANLNYGQRKRFLKSFIDVSRHFDYVVLDLSSGISSRSIDFALLAEKTIVVTAPTDLMSGYGAVKGCFVRFMELETGLTRRVKGYKAQQLFTPYVLVNNVRDHSQGKTAFDALEDALQNRLKTGGEPFGVRLNYLGSVFHNPRLFKKSENKRRPVSLVSPYSSVAYSIDKIAEAICSDSPFKSLDHEKRLMYTMQILIEHQAKLKEKLSQRIVVAPPARVRLLERRRYPRFQVNCPLSFVSFDRLKTGETLDLGLKGMRIESRSMLFAGEIYDFTLIVNGDVIAPKGKVVHVENRSELDHYGAHVSFMHLSENHLKRLGHFLLPYSSSQNKPLGWARVDHKAPVS
jgi:flagellar biosynthesis protein FlhG